ncbi:hypothetical protein [Rhodoferax sp. BLA1]|nr:hypothetical protein [Rhodoferax sp. BLA1]
MKNDTLHPTTARSSPRQIAANRRLALGLALFALAAFVSYVLRQWWVTSA